MLLNTTGYGLCDTFLKFVDTNTKVFEAFFTI